MLQLDHILYSSSYILFSISFIYPYVQLKPNHRHVSPSLISTLHKNKYFGSINIDIWREELKKNKRSNVFSPILANLIRTFLDVKKSAQKFLRIFETSN